MPSIKANDRTIAAAAYAGSGAETEFRVEGVTGLVLAVGRPRERDGKSAKTWRCQYEIKTPDGKRVTRKKKLGRYPVMGLRQARQSADALRDEIEDGVDVVAEERRAALVAEQSDLSMVDVIDAYVASLEARGIKTSGEVARALRANVVPSIGHLAPSAVTPVDIERTIDAIAKRGRQAMARHVLTYTRGAFNFVLSSPTLSEKFDLQHNPAERVGRSQRGSAGKYGKPKARDRSLNDDEVLELWQALGSCKADKATVAILKLLLLTGQRVSEVREAPIAEFRLSDPAGPVWELPRERAKNDRAHTIPLSEPVVELLRETIGNRKRGFLFPGRDNDAEPYSRPAVGRALTKLFEGTATQGSALTCDVFTPHDLRRTVETGLARMRIGKEIRDRILNHVDGSVGGQHYNKHDYLDEKREALDAWAAHVMTIVQQ